MINDKNRRGHPVFCVSAEELDKVKPMSKEFMEECKKVADSYRFKLYEVEGSDNYLDDEYTPYHYLFIALNDKDAETKADEYESQFAYPIRHSIERIKEIDGHEIRVM